MPNTSTRLDSYCLCPVSWPACIPVKYDDCVTSCIYHHRVQVPVRHQLLVVNTFSLLDAAFISWVGNQSDWLGKMKSRLGLSSKDKEG